MSSHIEHRATRPTKPLWRGKRVLIIGHSHYISPEDWQKGERDRSDFTEEVIEKITVCGERWAFFTSIANAFGENDPTDFFTRVAFMNFIPSVVEFADSFGSSEQIVRGKERLQAELDKFQPDVAIIFSTKVWSACFSQTDRSWHIPNGEKHWVSKNMVRQHEVVVTRHPRGAAREHLQAAVRIALGNDHA